MSQLDNCSSHLCVMAVRLLLLSTAAVCTCPSFCLHAPCFYHPCCFTGTDVMVWLLKQKFVVLHCQLVKHSPTQVIRSLAVLETWGMLYSPWASPLVCCITQVSTGQWGLQRSANHCNHHDVCVCAFKAPEIILNNFGAFQVCTSAPCMQILHA